MIRKHIGHCDAAVRTELPGGPREIATGLASPANKVLIGIASEQAEHDTVSGVDVIGEKIAYVRRSGDRIESTRENKDRLVLLQLRESRQSARRDRNDIDPGEALGAAKFLPHIS